MTDWPWRYSNMMRRGQLIEWTSTPIHGCDCAIISIQAMSESREKRFPDEHVTPRRRKQRQGHG